jgi:dephospho-CoA kinase
MKRILLTGMSATGKSTLVDELASRGQRAVSLDEPEFSEHAPDGEWVWREDRVQQLLSTEDAGALFVSGCASNQAKFYGQFDAIILLTAPAAVIVERLRTRTNNSFGKSPDELAQVLDDLEHTEPRLRRAATHVVDTDAPFTEVVAAVLSAAGVTP